MKKGSYPKVILVIKHLIIANFKSVALSKYMRDTVPPVVDCNEHNGIS